MKVVKIVLIIIGVVALLFILNYLRINIHYHLNKNNYKESFLVQGNKEYYVPQGLTYSSKYNVVLQTSYNSKHDVSRLYITDFKTKKLLKTLNLIEIDDKDNTNHVGGITTNNETVWITNDYEVNEYSLEEIINTNNDYIKSINNTKLPIRGDFCFYKDNTLYIGDFCLKPFYPVPDNNPLLLAYNTNNIDYNSPKYIISLPKMVQSMEINNNNEFLFTASFTYLITSKLLVYKNVLKEKASTYTLNGKKYPYYKFSKNNLIRKDTIPPMAEGMFYKNNRLYILFENSSDAYKPALPKMKNVIIYTKE